MSYRSVGCRMTGFGCGACVWGSIVNVIQVENKRSLNIDFPIFLIFEVVSVYLFDRLRLE